MNEAISASLKAKELYEKGFNKWEKYLQSLPATKSVCMCTQGRIVHGLGSQNVLEAGLTLHHLYGTPIIPGSSLKGLAAHYCDEVWGASEEKFKNQGEYHNILFGSQEDAGHIVFHDAWILPGSIQNGGRSGLVMDVMTPHHGEYYSGKSAPTDYDSPVPVSFLSVTGEFLLSVSCDSEDETGEKWAELALELVKEVLSNWGAGGKTSSGYGRFRAEDRGAKENTAGSAAAILVNPHDPGDKAVFTRIDNSKKGKPRFKADDGFTGNITSGAVPDIEIGETVELTILTVNAKNKNYTVKYLG
jgi:CRISPR type III-B/RAMP module RAMP protein Cmr6